MIKSILDERRPTEEEREHSSFGVDVSAGASAKVRVTEPVRDRKALDLAGLLYQMAQAGMWVSSFHVDGQRVTAVRLIMGEDGKRHLGMDGMPTTEQVNASLIPLYEILDAPNPLRVLLEEVKLFLGELTTIDPDDGPPNKPQAKTPAQLIAMLDEVLAE